MNKKIPAEIFIGIIVIIAIILGAISWFSNRSTTVKDATGLFQNEISKTQQPLQPINTSDWLIYKDKDSGLEFRYPKEMNINKLFLTEEKNAAAQGFIHFATKNSLQEITRQNTKNKQCGPYMCPDGKTIDENFNILSKSAVCPYEEKFKEGVKSSYQLFSGLLDRIALVDGIKNDNIKVCILKTIGSDGGSATVDTLYYRASFLNNRKAYLINFPIFPLGVFRETDDYLIKKGIVEKDHDGYASGNGDETGFFESFLKDPTSDPIGQKNMQIYDAIISTLRFSK